VFCQVPPCKIFFAYGEKAGPQAMADPGSALTVVLIAVFVAALVFGLLFLVGTKRQTIKSGTEPEYRGKPPPVHREQAGGVILTPDTTVSGVGHLFRRMDNAVNLFFSGLIFLYKWAFNYNGRPAAPAATTVIGEEPHTVVATPPPPEPVTQPAGAIPAASQPQPSPPALAVTRAPAIFVPPMTPTVQPTPTVPARPYGLQAIIDIMGEGIEIALTGMSDGIVFIFDVFINLFKWIFRIDRQ
jgi:hypothetical protein